MTRWSIRCGSFGNPVAGERIRLLHFGVARESKCPELFLLLLTSSPVRVIFGRPEGHVSPLQVYAERKTRRRRYPAVRASMMRGNGVQYRPSGGPERACGFSGRAGSLAGRGSRRCYCLPTANRGNPGRAGRGRGPPPGRTATLRSYRLGLPKAASIAAACAPIDGRTWL